MPIRKQFDTDESFRKALRDYFAAQALPMLIAAYLDEAKRGRTPDNPTVVAYVMADAMLKAREAQP